MIDEKDSRQNSDKTDSSEDDVIIDLTDEVTIKTEEDDGITDLKEDLTVDDHGTDNKVKISDMDEDLNVWPETSNTDNLVEEDDVILEPDDHFADDEIDRGEDELIASAINESLGSDEDETYGPDDEFDRQGSDDDVIALEKEQDLPDISLAGIMDDGTLGAESGEDVVIVNNAPLDEDEDIVAINSDGASDTQEEEDIFDLEEEIELEYELDEDEDEPMALDDERIDDQPDFFNVVLGETEESDRRDQTEEPTEYVEIASQQPNDILDLDEGGDQTQAAPAAEDAAVPEHIDTEDLPDLAADTELDFEDDDEAENVITMIGEETDSGDDIIARTVERSLGSDGKSEPFKPIQETEFGSKHDSDVIDMDAARQADEDIVALEDDELLDFEDDEDLLVDLGGAAEMEDDDEIIPLDGLDDFDAEKEDNIVEITEFDEYYPTDSDKMLEKAGILDTENEEEDDFLELIDVEEDRQTEAEEIIGIGESDEKSDYAGLDNFFSDALEEEGTEHAAAAAAFSNTSADDAVSAEEEADGTEDTPAQEFATESAAPDSEEEVFDFNFDPGSIAHQVDRLDAFLSEDSSAEPEGVSRPGDYSTGEKAIQEELAAGPDSEDASPFSPGQIDQAIERIINEKFSGKIENIIYEVIEKAVAKEIDRLKGALLGSIPPDDN